MRSPARDAVACGDAGPGRAVLAMVVPVSSMTLTTGFGVGTYTAVVVSDTAITRAPESAATPGSGTILVFGLVLLVGGPQQRQPQVGSGRDRPRSTDTAVELAAADTSRHSGWAGTSGLIRASSAP